MSDHIPDLTNMIGETPRTDLMEQHAPVGLRRNAAFEQSLDLLRQLERELNWANQIAKKYEDRYFECLDSIKRLEKAGDAMVETTTTPAAEAWHKAKEAKP